MVWRYLLIFRDQLRREGPAHGPLAGGDPFFDAAFFTLISQHGSVILNAYIAQYGSREDSEVASNAFAVNAVAGMALFVAYVLALPWLS